MEIGAALTRPAIEATLSPVDEFVFASFAMAALRILCLFLLSGGLLMQPVLLQASSCCCAVQESDAAVDSASDSSASFGGCPNCRAARQTHEPAESAPTVHNCSCSEKVNPEAVARISSVTDVEFQFAAVECPFGSSIPIEGSVAFRPQPHPPGPPIPARVLKCSWLL
jgi:hypothetical protein